MVALSQLRAFVSDVLADWRSLRLADLFYTHRDVTILLLVALLGMSLVAVIVRSAVGRRPGVNQVALPAILHWSGETPLSIVRHGALLLFLAGLPFFVIALSDPYTALTEQEVTFPGRRIAVMIDASSS